MHRSRLFTASNLKSPLIRNLAPSWGSRGILLIFLILHFSGEASAQSPVILRPDPLLFQVQSGEEKTLTFVLENAVDVYGIQVSGHYDPLAIEIIDSNPARTGTQMSLGTIPKPDLVMVNSADNLTGSFQYTITQMNPTLPTSGTGTVFAIQVRGKSPATSALAITSIRLADQDGTEIPVSLTTGVFDVLPAPDSIVLYLPLLQKSP